MKSPWKPFSIFCGFALLLLALVPLLSMLLGTSMNFGELARRASQETQVEWTSNLWNMLRLCSAEPGLWLLLLGSSVPTLAALATLAVVRNQDAWRDWTLRLTPQGPNRVAAGNALRGYTLLFVSMIACLLAVFVLRGWLSPGEYIREPELFSAGLLSAIAFSALLDQGAVLEEAGWRGYATPLLQRGGVTPLGAAVIVGIVWGLWHVPRDVVSGVIERLGMLEYLLLFLPAFVLGTVTTSVVASYFMNRLGGSLLPAIMVHGLTNDAMGFAGLASIDQALTPYHQITKAIPFALLAIAIVAAAGERLGLSAGPLPKSAEVCS